MIREKRKMNRMRWRKRNPGTNTDAVKRSHESERHRGRSAGSLCLDGFVLLKDRGLHFARKGTVSGFGKMFVLHVRGMEFRIEFKDRAATVFDGSKCMFKYYLNMQKL